MTEPVRFGPRSWPILILVLVSLLLVAACGKRAAPTPTPRPGAAPTATRAGAPGAAAPTPTPRAVAPAAPAGWKLFTFRGGEHFKYEIKIEQTGDVSWATLDATLKGSQVELALAGEMDGSPLPAVAVTIPQGQVPTGTQWGINPLGMVLSTTVMWPLWGSFLAGKELKAGQRLTVGSGPASLTIELSGDCTFAGVKGLLGRYSAQGTAMEFCVSQQVPLLLMTKVTDLKGTVIYDVRLVEYRPGR